MKLFTRKKESLEAIVHREVMAQIPVMLKELKPDASYILFVPEGVPFKELVQAMDAIRVKVNLVVVQANGVKLIEVT